MKKAKPILMWGGFVDDKLDVRVTSVGFGGWESLETHWAPAVFKSRAEARRQYQDVRRVEIREVRT